MKLQTLEEKLYHYNHCLTCKKTTDEILITLGVSPEVFFSSEVWIQDNVIKFENNSLTAIEMLSKTDFPDNLKLYMAINIPDAVEKYAFTKKKQEFEGKLGDLFTHLSNLFSEKDGKTNK